VIKIGLTYSKLEDGWDDWQIPREAQDAWSAEARSLHAEWWTLRDSRQKAIDNSIGRRAETKYFYNDPYPDSRRIRVSGPFTVESLSPHRVLSPDADRPATEAAGDATTPPVPSSSSSSTTSARPASRTP